eukprot:g2691.t1
MQLKAVEPPSLLRDFIDEAEASGLNFISEDRLKRGRRLGSGTFSVVYEAELIDDTTNKTQIVAIKELKRNRTNFQTHKDSFLTESTLLRKLQHPNVVGYIGAGFVMKKQPTLFMAQELIDGGSLDAFMQKMRRSHAPYEPRKSYTLKSAVRWCIQTASAVCYLHSEANKVIHRDIKLSNLLLTDVDLSKSDVKLADFGLAVDASKIEYSQSAKNLTITQAMNELSGNSLRSWKHWWKSSLFKKMVVLGSNQVPYFDVSVYNNCYDLSRKIGSYMYMSPEVYLGVPYNEKADIYSLGILLAEILIGMPLSCCVLPERSYEEAKNFAFCVSRGLRLKCPKSFPKAVASVLEKCWSYDPSERPGAEDLVRVFQLYELSCKNSKELLLFPPVTLSIRQKISLSLGRVSSIES